MKPKGLPKTKLPLNHTHSYRLSSHSSRSNNNSSNSSNNNNMVATVTMVIWVRKFQQDIPNKGTAHSMCTQVSTEQHHMAPHTPTCMLVTCSTQPVPSLPPPGLIPIPPSPRRQPLTGGWCLESRGAQPSPSRSRSSRTAVTLGRAAVVGPLPACSYVIDHYGWSSTNTQQRWSSLNRAGQ